MPVYEYACPDCGAFSSLRPMKEYQNPAACPRCGRASPRALLSAPAISALPTAQRHAHAVNEQARHAPRLASQTETRHGPGCGCCGKKSGASVTAAGEKLFPKKRPWMISH